MYHFRPFRNADPPLIAEIWRDQPPQRGLMQLVTPAILEQLVFSKPYFDPQGLVLAFDGDSVVGFVHAGFGANDEQTDFDTSMGTTYQLMLRADNRNEELADELLRRAEDYLRDRGAKVLYGGGIRPFNAFYLGLYGGSELPGVLVSDPVLGAACLRNGYHEIDRVQILQLELARFRPPVTRSQRQLRRELSSRENYCPPAQSRWEAYTIGDFERLRFSLTAANGPSLAQVDFWDIEPLSTYRGVATAGMFDLRVTDERRRHGLATFLLAGAFERLRNRGIVLVEAQTMQHNAPALALYAKLGFTKVDEGVVYRKESL
ncbi:MAG: GNAT family N-acetyltransferase [Planctomycetes bacterium]|nr:GNAT family N-acetyltransferase [Planctomycetota bacterium]